MINLTPQQIEELKKQMMGETGMMAPAPIQPAPIVEAPILAPVVEAAPVSLAGMLGTPEVAPAPNLTPATPTPQQQAGGMFQPSGNEAYDARIQELMAGGKTYDQAVAGQKHSIQQGKDLNGDGVVTADEFRSKYTSWANPDMDQRFYDTGEGMGSVYISSAKDDDGVAGGGKFEALQRANDALLGEGQEWGFEDGASGQWGTYGGPGFSQDAAKSELIDLERSGFGDSGLVGGPRRLGELYKKAEWTKADVSKGAKLGQVIDTPMGKYMVVNGMDGQLALKGLKGATHGGGNYFFSAVDKGYHLGIDPRTGDVWFQQAPDVVDLAKRVEEVDGDFITAMTSGLYSGDLGVWTKERVERFNKGGVNGDPAYGGGQSPSGSGPKWSALEWSPTSGSFLGAYNREKDDLAKKKSVMSLFKEMKDYGV
jgi:hypothetical protein